MKSIVATVLCIVSSLTYAAQTVTLTDGRQVLLNDDFTWQYVAPANSEAPSASTSHSGQPAVKATIATIPIIEKKLGAVIELGNPKPIMQLSDSGVDVLLGSARYESGQLIIPTSLTNQSSQSIIMVELDVELTGPSGNVIERKKVKVWTSIKRMADTYLRPQQAQTGKAIQFSVEREQHYQLNAEITTVESR